MAERYGNFSNMLRDIAQNQPASGRPGRRLQAGDLLGRYRLRRILGRGGFGEVWAAKEVAGGAEVALKVLMPAAQSDPPTLSRFDLEIRALSMLDHPNIARLVDLGVDGGRRFFAMEVIKGRPFNETPLALRPLLEAFVQMLAALTHAHARGFVHRDLKPDNVLLIDCDSIQVKVLDFGIARSMHAWPGAGTARETAMGVHLGTPSYMSPEQCDGAPSSVGPASDLYALGIMLYEALSGSVPFAGGHLIGLFFRHMHEPPPELVIAPNLSSQFDGELRRLVHHLLEKRYVDRPQTAAQVGARLNIVLSQLPRGPRLREASEDSAPSRVSVRTVESGAHEPDAASFQATMDAVDPRSDEEAEQRPKAIAYQQSWMLPFLRQAPLVGRQAELQALQFVARRALIESRPHAVVLQGPPGVGKTRLVRALAQHLEETLSARVLTVELAAGQGFKQALIQVLRNPIISEKAIRARLASELSPPVDAPTDIIVERLLRAAAEPPDRRWCDAFMTLLARAGTYPRRRPVLLCIEGDGGPDGDAAAWVSRLLDSPELASCPVVAIWTRPMGDNRLSGTDRGTDNLTVLNMLPLGQPDVASIVDFLVPGLPKRATSDIAARSGGNVGVVRALLWHLWESHGLAVGPDGPHLDQAAFATTPTQISDLIASNLERFLEERPDGTSLRDSLLVLSHCCFSVSPRLRAPVSERLVSWALGSCETTVDDLVAAGWLRPLTAGRTPTLVFSSLVVAELLFDLANRSERRAQLVEAAVNLRMRDATMGMVETEWEGVHRNINSALQLIGDHNPPLTLELYSSRALACGLQGSVEALRQAAQTLDDWGEATLGVQTRAKALAALWFGRAEMMARLSGAARRRFAEAEGLAGDEDLDVLAALSFYRAELARGENHTDEAMRGLDDAKGLARKAAEQAGNPLARGFMNTIAADATRSLAALHGQLGHFIVAKGLLNVTILDYRRRGDRHGHALALLEQVRTFRREAERKTKVGDDEIEAVGELLTSAQAMFGQLSSLPARAMLLWECAAFAELRGRDQDAAEHYAHTAAIYEEMGDLLNGAACINAAGEILRRAGKYDDALERYETAHHLSKALGNDSYIRATGMNLGWLALDMNVPETALQRFSAIDLDDATEVERQDVQIGLAIAAKREPADCLRRLSAIASGPQSLDLSADARAALIGLQRHAYREGQNAVAAKVEEMLRASPGPG